MYYYYLKLEHHLAFCYTAVCSSVCTLAFVANKQYKRLTTMAFSS